MSAYPSPEQLNIPVHDDPSPDQQYYVGWMVQHNRLWLFVAALGLLSFLLTALLVLQAYRYQPSIQHVTFDGAYPVLFNQRGNAVVDGVEFVPARVRHVIKTFIENRYAYDWQRPYRLNTALRLMSPNAAETERSKIAKFDYAKTIIATQTVVALELDYTAFKMAAKGKGIFEVTIEGRALINDAIRNPDPAHPATKPITIRLTLQAVPETDVNPFGYVVIATDRDLL